MTGPPVSRGNPYGIEVTPTGPVAPDVAEAIEQASKRADKVIADLTGKRRKAARRAKPRRKSSA